MPISFQSRSLPTALLLVGSLCLTGLVLALPEAPPEVAEQNGPASWVRQLDLQVEKGKLDQALEAGKAGLSLHPWHPELTRSVTLLYLEQGDEEALFDWMDELTMGDARQAERLFELPPFETWLQQERFASLQKEAYRQARD